MNGATTGRVHGRPHPYGRETFPRQPATPRGHILVMGDSHAADWIAPFAVVGNRLRFNVTDRTKPRCPPTLAALGNIAWPDVFLCQQWIAEGIDMAVRERPLAVVFVSYSAYVIYICDLYIMTKASKSFELTHTVAQGWIVCVVLSYSWLKAMSGSGSRSVP